MSLEHLRIFVGVAEREHMTKAAEALAITQSAASAAVAALEARHGVPLFHRVGRRIALSDAGRMFLAEAKAVLGRMESAEAVLADYAGLQRGTLRLVASQTIAGYWLPRHLAAFRRRHPGIGVELAIANTDAARAQILDGGAELGFVEGAVDDPAIARRAIGEDRMLLVSAETADDVDEAWLRARRWIVRETGSGTRSSFEAVLRARGFDPGRLDIAMTLPSNEAVRSAVEAGAGVAVLSELVVARAIGDGSLHALPFALPARPFFALRHKERYRTRAADALLDLIGEQAR
ncbi:MAG TPA: LysR substrate-binding domain-containing protein [Sphingomonas sp.]